MPHREYPRGPHGLPHHLENTPTVLIRTSMGAADAAGAAGSVDVLMAADAAGAAGPMDVSVE
eukprot:10501109-Prorocentrum_lima.AAC.1